MLISDTNTATRLAARGAPTTAKGHDTATVPKKESIMSPFDIVRAWKDAEYRRSLSPELQAQIPASPAGLIELADADLDQVSGGLMASNPSKTCCVSHHC